MTKLLTAPAKPVQAPIPSRIIVPEGLRTGGSYVVSDSFSIEIEFSDYVDVVTAHVTVSADLLTIYAGPQNGVTKVIFDVDSEGGSMLLPDIAPLTEKELKLEAQTILGTIYKAGTETQVSKVLTSDLVSRCQTTRMLYASL